MKGKFYGIGVGPGDPELLSLKAYRILQEVEVLCLPKAKSDGDSLAYSIVSKAVHKDFQTLELLFPMSKDEEVLKQHWDRAAANIKALLAAGKSVAFITIGDPMFYSTYSYLLERIRPDGEIEIQTIPGITAFSACSSYINQPLVEGDQKLAIIPAAYDLSQIKETLINFEVIVLMKVNKVFDEIVGLLGQLDLLGNAVYISRCGHDNQFYTRDLQSLIGEPKDYMSILMIKKNGWEGL